jgi:hypothetical protein
MLAVIGLDANVGRKQVAAGLTRLLPGSRLLVELGLSGSTWTMRGAPRGRATPTLEALYDTLRSRADGMRRARVPLEAIIGAASDLETGKPLDRQALAERGVVPVLRAPAAPTAAAEGALELGGALVELFVQLERSFVLGPTTVVVDLGWIAPGLVGQAPWAAAASDLVLVCSERPHAVAMLGYFQRAFPQAQVWVIAVAEGRRRRRRLAEVARFALRTRHGVEVVGADPRALSGDADGRRRLDEALAEVVSGSTLALVAGRAR